MFTPEENDILARVGPGTPMGSLMREYWHPVLLSSELPQAGGPPLRVRVLGEDLVAFRNPKGELGLLAEFCPHRLASLFFGRNEDEGLRCVYHGWQFDRGGHCVDMPNERPESNFAARVRTTAYQVQERGGIIWAYLGPRATPPSLPELEWNMLPPEHVIITKVLRECNWLQTLEGDIDSSHVNFLHGDIFEEGTATEKSRYWAADSAPRMEARATGYGTMVGARRRATEDSWFYRVTTFLMPYHVFVAPVFPWSIPGHAWVPMDDERTSTYNIFWNPHHPIDDKFRAMLAEPEGPLLPFTDDPRGQWLPVANRSNSYLVDRQAQRTRTFTGIAGIPLQDRAMAESMGPIVDRSRERLGTADAMIIKTRRRLLEAALALRDQGTPPPGVDDPDVFGVRSASIIVPTDSDWTQVAAPWMEAFSDHEVAFL